MSDRVASGVSDSGSSDSENNETAGVGRGSSPLGTTGQDKDGSSKSEGGSSPSRGSLASPGREPLELGARPKEGSDKRGEKGGKGGKRTGKGIEWNKKDRRRAKFYRGRGQEFAAERAAKTAAEEAARAAKDAAEGRGGDKRDDGSGLIVLRAEGPRTHHHGHHSHRRTKPERGDIDPDMGRFGNLFGGLYLLLFIVTLLGAPIAALVCLLDMASDAAETQGDAPPTTGPVLRSGYYRAVAIAVMYLILLTCVIALTCAASGSSSKNKKRKK
ncbi:MULTISPECIES: hypothetical protein [Candidatus Ichthyocystis]|nr:MULTISPECIES: hypothetical protein [Ichthyocystis]